ncbi:MAG: LysM peptidoglycan-binding domain-containing protein [marine benthic group bacterium]|nr:LysM peptidoglycan-binding domain-containing protein [Candidatus Carthagonibacter metallireducens]MCL7964510.1 LysM peptidoglycan-binding domain-containing protein [Gemmatimonadota bacterium]MCL7967134.1 LysM peptidoglycan-binding domain-containing protein [Gemmatimonadota bacterium]MCL7973452.1 LysM peptidoglycan-binding domain-containing protein [Gemmatimonadota bacterium]MCL7980065.1 LysM peptidoglycan-binding domain-containing protein [Gemmatimonadota bacterium]
MDLEYLDDRFGRGAWRIRSARPAILLTVLVLAACSGRTSPQLSPVPESLANDGVTAGAEPPASASAPTLGEVASEALDAWEGESPGFQDDVLSFDEGDRRSFYHIYGSDPLGLSERAVSLAERNEIPLEMNEHVERWIDFFTTGNGRTRFRIYLERAGAYEEMIRRRLRQAGLPEDLLYLAMIESGMNPNAYSRAHAVGLWQFIRGTGRLYDLEIGYWLDERRDPFKATDAAVAHLRDLYEDYGSWYLAAAAYNGGPGRVNRGIARTGSNDFWDLSDARVLRRETRNYVPKLIAATTIAKNPVRYGFDDVVPQPPLAFDVVEVPDATSFDVLAEAAGTTEDEIRRLNPQYPRRVTPPDTRAEVRVPPGTAATFTTAYAQVPASERVTWLEHVVTRGQTLSHIADRYGVSITAIRATNNNVNPRRLQIGQKLIIPRSGRARARVASAAPAPAPAVTSEDGSRIVTVQRGDTLWTIARAHGVTTRDLMAMNNLKSSRIYPGDRLTVGK